MQRKKRIVIIGAGFGGLSAAALLAKDGFKVTVLEKNPTIGGRARVLKKDGFAFDMGPSWYLMPEVFEKFFAVFGKKPSDYYQLRQLDPAYQIIFGKDDIVKISKDLDKNLLLFESFEEGGGKKLKQYLDRSNYQYSVSMNEFIYKDFNSVWSFFNRRLLIEGRKLKVFEPIGKYVNRFFSSERAKKIIQYNIVFLGGSPKNTPAIYSVMTHVDFNLGVWYPMGGFGSVVNALEKLCKELGVEVKIKTNVKKIRIARNGLADRVITDKSEYEADIVLANADYQFVESKLLDKKHQSYPQAFWQKKTLAPSAFILYLGLNKRLKKLAHHNLFLANDWIKHFDDIFKNPGWPDNPSYYVSAPSKTDPSVAPEGFENLFVLVPIATNIKDTAKIREDFSRKIIKHLEELIGEDIVDSIIVKQTFSINDFKNDYNAYQGTALGLSHTLFQTAVFRPKNQSRKIKNLFYTGQYTIPGIGVPMVFISSQIVSEKISKLYKNK